MDELDDRSRRALLGLGLVAAGVAAAPVAAAKRPKKPPLASVVVHVIGVSMGTGAVNLDIELFFLDLRVEPPTTQSQTGTTSPVAGSAQDMQERVADFARFSANARFGVPEDRVSVWIV